MKYCKHCGVELEEDMQQCPLCGTPATDNLSAGETLDKPAPAAGNEIRVHAKEMTKAQKTLIWEIISVILLSAIIATLLVNVTINKNITWAEYPVAVCLVIFSFVSFFTFQSRNIFMQVTESFVASAVLLLILDSITGGVDWSFRIAIPILFIAALIAVATIQTIRRSAYKGINLIAYIFVGSALLCISIEAVISFYRYGRFQLKWSLIVALCTVLVAVVLLFMHFRFKKGRSLEKIFHV